MNKYAQKYGRINRITPHLMKHKKEMFFYLVLMAGMIIVLGVIFMVYNISAASKVPNYPQCLKENGMYDPPCVGRNAMIDHKIKEAYENLPAYVDMTHEEVDAYCREALEKAGECYIF